MGFLVFKRDSLYILILITLQHTFILRTLKNAKNERKNIEKQVKKIGKMSWNLRKIFERHPEEKRRVPPLREKFKLIGPVFHDCWIEILEHLVRWFNYFDLFSYLCLSKI